MVYKNYLHDNLDRRHSQNKFGSALTFAKSVTKKTKAGLIVLRQTKRLCKPFASTSSAAVRLNELARKCGGIFGDWGFCPDGAARNELKGEV